MMRREGMLGPWLAVILAALPLAVSAQEVPSAVPGLTMDVDAADPAKGEEVAVRGRMTSPGRAVLSAQVAAPIVVVSKRVGESFRKGETLIAFDCRRIEARVDAAQARASAAATSLKSLRRMLALESVGAAEVEMAEAELRGAAAEVSMQKVEAEYCTVKAPFDGRVVARMISPHESVAVGTELMAIIDEGAMEVEVLVPSTWLRFVSVGLPFTISMDATGKSYPAEVTRLGGEIDPASQSVQVFGRLTGAAADEVLNGMSGRVIFDTAPASPGTR